MALSRYVDVPRGMLWKWDSSTPDDIRSGGFVVAVHNDYRQDQAQHTFWLFTRDGVCHQGEGLTDAGALNGVREMIDASEGHAFGTFSDYRDDGCGWMTTDYRKMNDMPLSCVVVEQILKVNDQVMRLFSVPEFQKVGRKVAESCWAMVMDEHLVAPNDYMKPKVGTTAAQLLMVRRVISNLIDMRNHDRLAHLVRQLAETVAIATSVPTR